MLWESLGLPSIYVNQQLRIDIIILIRSRQTPQNPYRSFYIFFSALVKVIRTHSGLWYCNWPSRSDHHWLFPKVTFNFQISSAIFFLASTNPLALEFITILDGKQSRRFSSFANFLFLQGSNVKKYRAKQLKMSAVLGRQPSAWSPTMETKIKSPYLWIRITFLFTALIWRFCCHFGSDFKSIWFFFKKTTGIIYFCISECLSICESFHM